MPTSSVFLHNKAPNIAQTFVCSLITDHFSGPGIAISPVSVCPGNNFLTKSAQWLTTTLPTSGLKVQSKEKQIMLKWPMQRQVRDFQFI